MKRNHVHMSIGIGEGVTSGMRRDCEVYIYLDL
jgi:RNA:NAD 2'-phosphotransferase (TPT1/KptA family)